MIAQETRTQGPGARFLLVAASFVVVVAGLRAAAPILLPLFISLLLAILSLPVMVWLQRNRFPTALAVLSTIVLDVAVLAILFLVVGRSVNQFTDAAPAYRDRLQEVFGTLLVWLEARGIALGGAETLRLVNPGSVVDLAGSTLGAVATMLSNTFLVVLTVIFILFEAAGFSRKLRAAFGDRADHVQRLTTMARQVQRYLAMKTLISLATGLLAGIWVSVLGLGFALLWGLMAFLLNFIPNLGSILAAVPPVLLALVQFGPGRAIAVAVGYVVINVVLANFIEPYLMGRRLGLSTLIVFLSLVFWGWVWGPVGMLLSVPLTMIVKIALENTEDFRWVAVLLEANPVPASASPPSVADPPRTE